MQVSSQWSFSSAPSRNGSRVSPALSCGSVPGPSGITATKSVTIEPAAGCALHTTRHTPGVGGSSGSCNSCDKGERRDPLLLNLVRSWTISSEHPSCLPFHVVLLILVPANETHAMGTTCASMAQAVARPLCPQGPGCNSCHPSCHGFGLLSILCSCFRICHQVPVRPWLSPVTVEHLVPFLRYY